MIIGIDLHGVIDSDVEWFKDKLAVFKRPVVEIRRELPLSGKGETLKRKLIRKETEKRKSQTK